MRADSGQIPMLYPVMMATAAPHADDGVAGIRRATKERLEW